MPWTSTTRTAIRQVDADGRHGEASRIKVRRLGLVPYLATLEAMRAFTAARTLHSADEIWLLEHPPVFTQGFAGRAEYVHDPGPIPVIVTERGGQVTYHGPGQLVGYLLFDLRRARIGPRVFVARIEQALIDYLRSAGIAAGRRERAPGVYLCPPDVGERPCARPAGPRSIARASMAAVTGAKIASIGLKISHGRSYHGFALNVAMDLGPFDRIDPCGMPEIRMTDMRSAGASRSVDSAGTELAALLRAALETS